MSGGQTQNSHKLNTFSIETAICALKTELRLNNVCNSNLALQFSSPFWLREIIKLVIDWLTVMMIPTVKHFNAMLFRLKYSVIN